MREKLIEQLIRHEGEVLHAYACPTGFTTIGIGRNIDKNGGKGITKLESKMLLTNDIAECESDMQDVFGRAWEEFSDNRKIALIDMRFNLGPNRFRGFRRMIAAIRKGDWELAGKEAMDSRWATQVKRRSGVIYAQLVGG